MRLKLDENIPTSLSSILHELGHSVETVRGEGLCGRDDETVWQAAQDEGRFVVTQDLDFSSITSLTPGTHAGLMLVRLRDPSFQSLTERIRHAFDTMNVEEWVECVVVVSERKVRIRRPAI